MAELENLKKRHAKERSELIRYAGEALARDLLDVLDDLDRATAQSEDVATEELLKGVNLIRDSFQSVLGKHGIKGLDSIGTDFDPEKARCVSKCADSGPQKWHGDRAAEESLFFPRQVATSSPGSSRRGAY